MCYIEWGVIRNYKGGRNYAVKKKNTVAFCCPMV